MKKIKIIKIIIFTFIIILPIVTFNIKRDVISEIDNKKLMNVEDIFNVGDLTKGVESILNDRIGLRNNMVSVYNKSMDLLFDEMIHPNYQYGEDGYVFFKVSENKLDSEFQEIYSSFIKNFQEYCESRGIGFLYTVEPSKVTVYEEHLPQGYVSNDENLKYFTSLLKSKDVNYLDNSEVLINAKKDTQVFDKMYDAGHWNETGASIGISKIIDRLNDLDNRIGSLDLNKYEKVNHINKTLPASNFSINEETIHYNLIEDNSIQIDDYNDEVIRDSNYRTFSYYKNPTNEDLPKILIFVGSYFNGKEKFLTENFSEVIRVHNYKNVINYEYYINLFNPDIVLFESTEYTHSDTFFPREDMKNKVTNKNILEYQSQTTDNFVAILMEEIEKTGDKITNFKIPVESDDLLYAYSNINGRVLDCKININGNNQYLEFSVITSELDNLENVELYFVSKDEARYKKTAIHL